MQNKKSKAKQVRDTMSIEMKETTTKPITGVGDVIASATKKLGIDKVAKWIAGEDCGCEERAAKLNKAFPLVQPLCLNEEEYQFLTTFFATYTNVLDGKDANQLAHIWSRVFKSRKLYKPCSCTPKLWLALIEDLRKIYVNYAEV